MTVKGSVGWVAETARAVKNRGLAGVGDDEGASPC